MPGCRSACRSSARSMPTIAYCAPRGLSRRPSRNDVRRSPPNRTRLMNQSILHDTIDTIGEILGPELDRITVERAVVGLFFTGVKLSDGGAGACATPIETVRETFCCPSASTDARSPGRMRGSPAFEFAREALGPNGPRRALGIAA